MSPTLEAAFAAARGRGARGDGGHRAQARESRGHPAAGRRPLPRPGLRPGGDPAAGSLRRTPRPGGARLTRAPSRTAYREKFALTPPGCRWSSSISAVAVRAPVSGSEVVLAGARREAARKPRSRARRPAYFREAERLRAHRGVRPAPARRGRRPSAGPAVVEEEGSTLVIGPGATARVAASGNLVITLAGRPHEHPLRPDYVGGSLDADHLGGGRGGQGHRAHLASPRSPTRPTTSPACSPTRGAMPWPRTREHPVLHRDPARHRAPLPPRDRPRADAARATCSSPTIPWQGTGQHERRLRW